MNFMGSSHFNYPSRSYFPNQVDSIFGSPIPRNYQFDATSLHQTHYQLENSPPYDQDDDENYQEHNIKFIERLVCDDEIDFKSGGEYSGNASMMQSPQLSAVSGLRIPSSAFGGPGTNMNNSKSNQKKTWSVDFMKQSSSQSSSNSKGKL